MFASRNAFVQWVAANLPHKDYCGVEIDRVNNDGHYEPGNLKLSSRREQNLNKYNTARMMFRGESILVDEFDSPYERSWTGRLVNGRMSGEDIIQHAKDHAFKGMAKSWQHLRAWLDSHGYTTSPTQDHDAASPPQGS